MTDWAGFLGIAGSVLLAVPFLLDTIARFKRRARMKRLERSNNLVFREEIERLLVSGTLNPGVAGPLAGLIGLLLIVAALILVLLGPSG